MGGMVSGSGDQARRASGSYTGRSKGRSSDRIEEYIVDPPFGKITDPTVTKFGEAIAVEVAVSQGPDADLTWEQRALSLLSALTVAKGFKELRPGLKDEVQSLVDTAPESAKL